MSFSRTVLCLIAAGSCQFVPQFAWSQDGEQPAPPQAADSPLAVPPQTHQDRLEATILMANFGRLDLAKGYLDQILSAELSDEELLALRDKFGTAELFRLSRLTDLRPQSQKLLDLVSEASRRHATDPARIDRILQDLDKTPREREMAIVELKNIGINAVPRLLQHLADPKTSQDRDRISYILIQMGRQILPALRGATEATNPVMKSAVLDVVGLIGDSSVVDDLYFAAFSPSEEPGVQSAARVALARILHGSADKTKLVTGHDVAARLAKASREYFFRQREVRTEEDGRVRIWKWDATQKTVVPYLVSVEAARNEAALRYGRQAMEFNGEDRDVQALYLGAVLADAGYRAGWEEALPTGPGTAFNLAMNSGVPVLSRTVDLSLAAGRVRAAETAMTALSLVGNRNLLRHNASQPSPLIRGLNSTDHRVQFAAAAGVLQLDPETPFPNSGRVVEILLNAINDNGARSVLVIDPNEDRGRTIGGLTAQLGYTPQVVRTGKSGFKAASEQGDVSLILVNLNSIDWELSQTLANLRADSRTAGIPIAIYGPTYLEDETILTVRRTPLSTYMVYSDKIEDVSRQLKPFLDSVLSQPLTNTQRQRRSEAAMYWLNRIAEKHPKLFSLEKAADVMLNAMNDPVLAPGAVGVLTAIPTQQAQIYLAESILNPTNSAEVREQSALSLSQHIRKHGLLIGDDLVAPLKSLRDNESDLSVQTALTAVVGTLQPSSALVKERLQLFVPPVTPAEN